jgi:hypothetical protein
MDRAALAARVCRWVAPSEGHREEGQATFLPYDVENYHLQHIFGYMSHAAIPYVYIGLTVKRAFERTYA